MKPQYVVFLENRLAHLIGSSVEGMELDGEEEDEINEEESFDPPDPEELIQVNDDVEYQNG